MSDLNSATWHELDSANTDAPPDGWPEGQPANSVNNCARAGMGALKRFYDRINATVTSTGSANAHVLTYTVAPLALVKGDTYSFISGVTNSGATTLNVGVGGAVPVMVGASALSAGSITVGDAVQVMYDGTNFQFTGWEPARTTGQNLSVNTLTVTGSGTSVTLSAGSLSVAGNVAVAGTGVFVGNITGGAYHYLSGSTGTVNSTGGSFLYGDSSNIVVHIGTGNQNFLVQNTSGTTVHTFAATGSASHAGTLSVTGATSLNSTLNVGSNTAVGGSLSVGTTLTVGSNTSITGALNTTGNIVAGGGLFATGGTLNLSTLQVLVSNPINTGYVVINDNAARASIILGSSDATNYYRQTAHLFQSQAGGVTWLTLSSGSFHATQNATFDGTLSAVNTISVSGSSAQFIFADRTGGASWVLYSSSNTARLYNGVDRVTVDAGGSIVCAGNITAANDVTAPGTLVSGNTCSVSSSGVIYRNIGAQGFNFRWDGAHVFTRVDNVVEYPIYSANGGTVSGSQTITGNLQVNGDINLGGNVNALSYSCSGIPSLTAGGGFVQILDLSTGLASILCGGSVIGIHYNIQMNNNIAISAHESGGTVRNMLLLNSSNNLIVGNTTTAVVDIESGGNVSVTATGNFIVSNNDAYKPGGGSWQAISDVRVKEDVRDYEVGLEALKLRPVTYKLNGKGGTVADGREYVGLVADEVEPIMPEMVGRLDDGELGEMKTIDSSALTFALLNVCKKLEARLAALEAK